MASPVLSPWARRRREEVWPGPGRRSWVMAMRWSAALSCRLPPRHSRWRSVRPGLTGIGATRRAWQAGLRAKAATPAVSAMSLAAVGTPQPGRLSRLGASRATRWPSSPVSWSMRAVSAQSRPSTPGRWRPEPTTGTGQPGGDPVQGGPGRRGAACSRSGPADAGASAARLIVLVRSAIRCSRWSTSSLTSQDAWSWPRRCGCPCADQRPAAPCRCLLRARGAWVGRHTSVGALPRSSQATPVGPGHGRGGST